MEIFKSKIDGWLLAILIFAIVVSLVSAFAAAKQTNMIVTANTLILGAGLPLWLLIGTQYIVSAQQLKVRCGPFSWSIPLSSITSVSNTRNPLSSPALSLDRLEIKYGNGKSVMVSPAEKAAFREAIGHPEQ